MVLNSTKVEYLNVVKFNLKKIFHVHANRQKLIGELTGLNANG